MLFKYLQLLEISVVYHVLYYFHNILIVNLHTNRNVMIC